MHSGYDGYRGERSAAQRVLWLSTVAFTLLFNVWLMLGVLGIPLRRELGLSDSQLEWLIAAAILSGSVLRLNFGIWADVYGGRVVMGLLLLGTAISAYLFSQATTYSQTAGLRHPVRPGGQQLLRRHRVELGVVSIAPQGNGAGNFWSRQRRRGGHEAADGVSCPAF